jgi:predicted unusual protein kinase regulating ubiquinone biosynthesis (AarF/ABC1/UbiB family)
LGRASKLGGVAAGHAARALGTRTANLGRSEAASQQAVGRQHLETGDRIVKVLGSMKGAAMKIGQTFSVIDVGVVPEEFRDEFQSKLASLQTLAPSVPFKDMRKVIEQDLGEKLADVFADFDEEAIAAASIGQVYRAVLRAPTPKGLARREVAVKVQYPRIKEIVRADLQNLGLILRLLARISPGLDTAEVAQEIRDRISEELDYELEAQNHRALAREYRGHPFIVVPPVVTELCRERVIVSEYVEGRRFAEVQGLPEPERSRFGEILFRFYVNGPFRHRLLNGDPHPGNSLLLDDGRVAFLDFGFFKRLVDDVARTQVETLQAVYAQDAERLYEITRREGVITGGREAVEPLMEMYRAATWWFMVDDQVTLTPDVATRIILEHGGMRGGRFGDVRLPAAQIVTLRAFMLVLGVVGQLRATNNWFRIGREVLFGEEPETELGRIEAEHLRSRGVSPAPLGA